MDKTEYNTIALAMIKKCQAQGDRVYGACLKEKREVTQTSLAGSWNFYCANQKYLEQTFCLHTEKEKAGITSSSPGPR